MERSNNMDMKKILQAMDGASGKKPVEGSDDMKTFIQITEGKGPLNRLTTAETIAVNHFTPDTRKTITSPVLNVAKDAKPSMIGKYFKKVEEEFAESQDRYKERARQLAERVIERMVPEQEPDSVNEAGGNYGHHSSFNKHVAQSKRPPDSIMQMAKKGARVDNKRRNRFEETEGVDSVTLDVPLMIRLMEFAREDAKDDMILHKVVERMVGMAEEGQALSMSDYDEIVGQVKEAHPNSKIYDKCWTGYKKVPGKKRGKPGSCEKK